MIVREFDRDADFDGMRACLIELQDSSAKSTPESPPATRKRSRTSGFSELYVDFEKDLTARAGDA